MNKHLLLNKSFILLSVNESFLGYVLGREDAHSMIMFLFGIPRG